MRRDAVTRLLGEHGFSPEGRTLHGRPSCPGAAVLPVGTSNRWTTRSPVETTDDAVAISVRDTGCGIAPEALPYIFEAFRQVENHLTRRHGGAGLGLAIAHKLAELMDGRITVDSAVGEGSTFTVLVPIAPPTHR